MQQNIQPASSPKPAPLVRTNPPGAPTAMDSITPKQIIDIIRRHILMIIIFTILGTVAGVGGFFVLRMFFPKYTAVGAIEVLPPGGRDPMAFTETIPNKDIYYGARVTKAHSIRQQNMYRQLIRSEDVRNTNWFNKFPTVEKAILDLEDHLGASPSRDGTFITVSMTCGSPKESALIVNEMMDLFITQQREVAQSDIRQELAERNDQRDSLLVELRTNESEMNTIRQGAEFANVDPQRNFNDYLDEKLADTEVSFDQLESDVVELEQLVETLRIRAQGEFDEVVREQIERDPTAQQIRRDINNLRISLSQRQARFGEDHRLVIETKNALDRAEQELARRQAEIADIERKAAHRNAQDQLVIQAAKLNKIQEQRNQTRDLMGRIQDYRSRYERAQTTRDELQDRLEQLNQNIQKLNLQLRSAESAEVKLLSRALEPIQPSFPKIIVFGPAGLLLGGMLGVGLAFAIELLNDKLRTPADAVKYLRSPLLGTIFHQQEDEHLDNIDPRIVVQKAPYSILSEGYRQLKANLKLYDVSQAKNTILISSCAAGCGKTSVAINIASALANEGKKILLIDTNLRRPAAGSLLTPTGGKHHDFGLSNYLMGQCQPEQIIRPSGFENLDVIDTGPMPQNPSGILSNQKMKSLIDINRNEYDYVILDGPPMLVSDSKVLASRVDGTILVLNASATRRGEAQRAIRELKNVDANVLGTVLLGVKSLKGGYFQEIYRSYHDYQKVSVPAQA